MNNILLILLSTTCFTYFIVKHNNNQFKKDYELNNKSDKIESCIDIENKNKRTIYENLKLSKHCIEIFGNNR